MMFCNRLVFFHQHITSALLIKRTPAFRNREGTKPRIHPERLISFFLKRVYLGLKTSSKEACLRQTDFRSRILFCPFSLWSSYPPAFKYPKNVLPKICCEFNIFYGGVHRLNNKVHATVEVVPLRYLYR